MNAAFNSPKLDERAAGLMAIGLLPNVQSGTLRSLRSVIDRNAQVIAGHREGADGADSSVIAGIVVAWSIRQHAQRVAQALGELLAAEHPTTLNRLIAGSNFTVRNDTLLPLQSLANGFLYDYLIASFGDDW